MPHSPAIAQLAGLIHQSSWETINLMLMKGEVTQTLSPIAAFPPSPCQPLAKHSLNLPVEAAAPLD